MTADQPVIDPAPAPAAPAPKSTSTKGQTKKYYDICFKGLDNRVRLDFLDGTTVEGILSYVTRYELVVDGVVFFKHALKSVSFVEEQAP